MSILTPGNPNFLRLSTVHSSESLNVFCLPDGTALQDEDTTLGEVFDSQIDVGISTS